MLSRLSLTVSANQSAARALSTSARALGAERYHYPQFSAGKPIAYGPQDCFPMKDSDYVPPTSEAVLYPPIFEHVDSPADFKDPGAVKKPVITDVDDLPESIGDPHMFWGFGAFRYTHYTWVREPTFPRKPDLAKKQLAAGATVVRTDVWKTPNEPAIMSIARFSPDNFRPVGYAENAPCPDTTMPEEHLDFRTNRLPIGHADRRPFIYFSGAVVGFISASIIRSFVVKAVWFLWPSKDVFAAGMIEVDLRQVRMGQNFVVKWRGKPVFIKRRPQEQIDLCRKDDALLASMRDPELDSERAPRPEWLIMLGVCTHLGCIPYPDSGDFNGWFCPCHGSHYDLAGRIRKGPAPSNFEIPPYVFIDDFTVKIG